MNVDSAAQSPLNQRSVLRIQNMSAVPVASGSNKYSGSEEHVNSEHVPDTAKTGESDTKPHEPVSKHDASSSGTTDDGWKVVGPKKGKKKNTGGSGIK